MRVYTTDLNFSSSLEGSLFVLLWESCVSEYLKEYTYMAANAALGFGLNAGTTGLDFSWAGYSDSMPAFVRETLKKVAEMRSADLAEIFDQVKEAHMLAWKNAYLKQTYEQLGASLGDYVTGNTFSPRDYRQALESYTYSDFSSDLQSWLIHGRLLWFVSGNLTPLQAEKLIGIQNEFMPLKPLHANLTAKVINPVGKHLINIDLVDEENQNSAFATYYQVDSADMDTEKKKLTFALMIEYIN